MFVILFRYLAFLCYLASSASADASMCATENFLAEKAIKHFQANSGSARSKKLLPLLLLGKDAFGVKEYQSCSDGTFAGTMANLSEGNLTVAWLDQIARDPEWKQLPSAKTVEMLKKEKSNLQNLFGQSSYGFAWVQKMTGDSTGAKTTLLKTFDERSTEALNANFTHNAPEIERTFKAVSPMLNSPEKKELEKRYQRVKIHLSNLPDAGIVT